MSAPAARAIGRIGVFVLTIAGVNAVTQAQAPPRGRPPSARALSIEAALEMSAGANESLAASRATITSARARVTSAESAYLPQIDVNASYQRTIRSEYEDLFDTTGLGPSGVGELPFAQQNTWRAGLSGSQVLWSGGRIESTVRAAEAAVEGAEVQLDSVRAQVAFDVTQAYYDAALAGRLVEVAEATLAQAEEALEHAKIAFRQGTQAEFDVLRAEVARDNERTNVINTASQKRVVETRLRRLVGLGEGVPLVLTSALDASDLEVVEAAAQRGAGLGPGTPRAPVREAAAFVDARLADLDLARAERFPTFSLTSQYGVVDYPAEVWFDRDRDAWRTNFTVMVVASFPLFTGFRRTADIRAARALVASSRARLAETIELTRVDELEADEQVANAQAISRQTGRTVEQATRAYGLAQVRYEAGVATHLDLVDARVVLQQARVNQARAARDLRVARVRRALLPGLPVALPTTFVITTASGGPIVPAAGTATTLRARSTAAPASATPVSPVTAPPTTPTDTPATR